MIVHHSISIVSPILVTMHAMYLIGIRNNQHWKKKNIELKIVTFKCSNVKVLEPGNQFSLLVSLHGSFYLHISCSIAKKCSVQHFQVLLQNFMNLLKKNPVFHTYCVPGNYIKLSIVKWNMMFLFFWRIQRYVSYVTQNRQCSKTTCFEINFEITNWNFKVMFLKCLCESKEL